LRARRWTLIKDGLQGQHRLRDIIGSRVGDRGRGLFECDQPRARDLPAERLAVADGKEPVAPTVQHQPTDAEFFEGRDAYFADPEGNYWEVAWSRGDNPVTAAARRAAGIATDAQPE
jgi:hypothetical protein